MEKIRLQKYMAECGVASRRACEQIILQNRVKVNNIIVNELGTKIDENDEVLVDGKTIKHKSRNLYILLNKPSGFITAVKDDRGRNTVMDLLQTEIHERIYPVGRLDYNTEGLLILTNDGEFANKLTHPKNKVGKTYEVHLNETPNINAIEKLKKGVMVDGKKTSNAKVELLRDNILLITIHEGRNRQVRKMAEAVGYNVEYLKRISIGNIVLGNLPIGRWRHLSPNEVNYLKNMS